MARNGTSSAPAYESFIALTALKSDHLCPTTEYVFPKNTIPQPRHNSDNDNRNDPNQHIETSGSHSTTIE